MLSFLIGFAFADQTGATVVCDRHSADCVTSGGLPGVCTRDLECATDICFEEGDACSVDGKLGKCAEEGECIELGCTTTGGAPPTGGLLALVLLVTLRRRGDPLRRT